MYVSVKDRCSAACPRNTDSQHPAFAFVKKKDEELLERVQRRAARMRRGREHLS